MSMSLMVLITSLYKVATGWLVRAVYGGSLHNVGVRLLYLPSLARMSFLWSYMGKKNWYDRVDDTVILGALPFRSQTKEVSLFLYTYHYLFLVCMCVCSWWKERKSQLQSQSMNGTKSSFSPITRRSVATQF